MSNFIKPVNWKAANVIGDWGRINIIVGENGIGKTRLLHKLCDTSKNAIFLDQHISIESMGEFLYEKKEIEIEYTKILVHILKNIEPKLIKFVFHDPYIFVKIKGVEINLPLEDMGHGFIKLFYYTFILLTNKNCAIMIDEIENGFYTDTLDILWQTINAYSKDNDLQFFITTHSLECIESFVDNVPDTDIALYRLEEERVVNYNKENIEISLDNDWAFR